jgi:hypothetical protein
MPTFTTNDLTTALTAVVVATTGTNLVEVFTTYPANFQTVSEGFYVSRVYQADRVIHSNGITPGGHVYLIKDRVEMYLITSQDNPFVDNQLGIFVTLLDNALFTAYHLREHTIEQIYAANSERYKVTFDLTRLQVI